MKSIFEISCPVSSYRINENVVRTAAFFVIILTGLSLYLNNSLLSLLLGFDFALRAFTTGEFSPVKLISKKTTKWLFTKVKLTDAAPKKFAAGIGMTFCLLITIFQILHFTTLASTIGFILIFCALLEGGMGICLGCIVYTYVILPFKK